MCAQRFCLAFVSGADERRDFNLHVHQHRRLFIHTGFGSGGAESDEFNFCRSVLDPWTLAAHVRSVADLARTDWAAQRRLTAEALPGLPVPAAPWQASHATIGLRSEVAGMGAHNRSVLADFGYDENTVAALQRSGALREQGR
jgi:hypothetical protein